MWGWTGRNTPSSLAALRAPTVSDRTHELKILERMALKVGYDAQNNRNIPDQLRDVMAEQGLREIASEKLADYKTMADVDMANNHLLHIPGAHGYLAGEYRKRKSFDTYIGALYAMGPQTMDQAWHYYKFIVKQQRPTDRDINELVVNAEAAAAAAEAAAAEGAMAGAAAEGAQGGDGRGGGAGTTLTMTMMGCRWQQRYHRKRQPERLGPQLQLKRIAERLKRSERMRQEEQEQGKQQQQQQKARMMMTRMMTMSRSHTVASAMALLGAELSDELRAAIADRAAATADTGELETIATIGQQIVNTPRMLDKDAKDDPKAGADASGLEAEWTSHAAQGDVKKRRMPMLNSDKYEEVKIPRLAQFDPSTMKFDDTVIAIGKRRTGKSFAYRHILHSLMEHFPAGICISQTDELNHYWRQYMPAKYIFNRFDPAILHAVFDRQKSIMNDARLTEEEREKKAPFFIILDDVISDTRIRYDPAIAELFVAGRHYKLFTMITTQYAKAITPTLRSNADHVLILHNKQEGQREALWRDFADFMTREAAVPLATNALPLDGVKLRMPEIPTAEQMAQMEALPFETVRRAPQTVEEFLGFHGAIKTFQVDPDEDELDEKTQVHFVLVPVLGAVAGYLFL
ncbi:hypothetical protein T492DRAFT_878318 [Pavlovales sp. CCMP2436]|nr:hypothetical protein T492DRAFT_878318 [Pavlovales sp. CCMP2436]